MSFAESPLVPLWTPDQGSFRERLIRWWEREGPALWIDAPVDEPWETVSFPPPDPQDPRRSWTEPEFRVANSVWQLAHRSYYGSTFPYLDTQIGPGSLGTFLGSEPAFRPDTVWYAPRMTDADVEADLSLEFDPENPWFKVHLDLVLAAVEASDGRFLVGMPDLIENIDTLAQLRGPEALMMDLLDHPAWVERRLQEINFAYYDAFEALAEPIRDGMAGNAFAAFGLWGPGRTAKVQCDACAMFSPKLFRDLVVPPLADQCAWLDYSMFHLDGGDCLDCLDDVLSIDRLDAVEWTPDPRSPSGGDPCWYGLYRRILSAGKAVQAINVRYDEVLPLFDAVGTDGVYVMTSAPTELAAARLARAVYG